MSMNTEAQEEVARILEAGPDNATEADIAFLTARRSYLTGEQKDTFGISDDAPKAKKSAKSASTDEA